jgi:hypothetical protein
MPFGTNECTDLHCNVVIAHRTRNKDLEKLICTEAKTELIPLLRRVQTKEDCKDVLFAYALQLIIARNVDPDSFKENAQIETRIKYLPRSFREQYGDRTGLPMELRQVWEI